MYAKTFARAIGLDSDGISGYFLSFTGTQDTVYRHVLRRGKRTKDREWYSPVKHKVGTEIKAFPGYNVVEVYEYDVFILETTTRKSRIGVRINTEPLELIRLD